MAHFLITIDTEGDNQWSRPKVTTTRNAEYLPRFQELCEEYGLKPTYLTNYEMAMCPVFREFAQSTLSRHTAEVGMHLHAWNSPPARPLTTDDDQFHPFLVEYPETAIREKVAYLTGLLEETFQTKMLSHRAGRWSFNARYARALMDHGYVVDCSVTPHVSWKTVMGDPGQAGGTDYTHFPESAYFVDREDISRRGTSTLLEVPMTILRGPQPYRSYLPQKIASHDLIRKVLHRFYPKVLWLRPRRGNLKQLLSVLDYAKQEERDYVEFMLHSSEFMPGGSPTFRTEDDIERLFDDLDQLFAAGTKYFKGATLSEYHAHITAAAVRPQAAA
jgi:hypothetical protein